MENIKVQNINSTDAMQISVGNSDYAVSITNNRAQYYSEQAKKYRDEAKTSRDEAKYYAEQNSNVTFEYIEDVKNSLVQQINTKQIQGDYALSSNVPQKVSEIENDLDFVTNTELNQTIAENTVDKDLSGLTDAGKTAIQENSYKPSLFQSMWSDHLLNRMDMLRADTFSWQSGTTYSNAYDKLVEEYNGESSTTETSGSITYKLTPSGFKIADATQEQAILDLYTSAGGAWYYILDTANTQFKLPRMNYRLWNNQDTSNLTKTSEDMKLYFYVGEYTQSAIEQTAGLNSELFNNKADITTPSIQAPYLKTTYLNGASGYNIWSNGYCEQWGRITATANGQKTITFAKTFKDTNYVAFKNIGINSSASTAGSNELCCYNFTATTMQTIVNKDHPYSCWRVCGYLAEGQY